MEKRLNYFGISLRLFAVPIKIDTRAFNIDFFDGETVDEVVEDFLVCVCE